MPATPVSRATTATRAHGHAHLLSRRHPLAHALSILACATLAACGGGDGGSSNSGESGTNNTAPVISGAPISVAPAGTQYSFMPTASDADRDALSFKIDNPPTWANFSEVDGSLSGAPSDNDVGTYRGIVITVSDGIAESSIPPFEITVTADDDELPPPPPPGNTRPTIIGVPTTQIAAGATYSFTPTADDADGDALTFTVANAPSWATFSATSGTLSGTPNTDDIGSYPSVVITVSDGVALASLAPFTITVSEPDAPPPPPNEAPTISGTPPSSVVTGNSYLFTPSAGDSDGDALVFAAANLPAWASLSPTTGTLSGTPTAGDEGVYAGIILAVSDGTDSAALPAFSITVEARPNEAPTIEGVPDGEAIVGEAYSFTPTADDDDGDTLTFQISNAPSWANFSSSTGTLSGTPDDGDIGTYTNIVIAVTDGTDSAALPNFSITVEAAPNEAPTIEGTPDTEVVAGNAYSFTPTADDADGDTLTFSIDNAPSWANFSSTTGTLSGTPLEADVGTYSNIVISVSDGTDTAALAAFTLEVTSAGELSVTLDWNPPTENTDDSGLTDLTSYRIYVGVEPGNYTDQVEVDNPGLSSFVVERMDAGTYYFAITAVNSLGIESDFSNEVTVTLPMD
ncbi:MAG: putative Ig domain-containing protein [Pseudomonadota bacterium]